MSIALLLRRLGKALPIVIRNLPAIAAAASDVRDAVRKEKPSTAGVQEAGPRLREGAAEPK